MPLSLSNKKIIIIGAGLGGLAAAISCAAKGAKVSVYEKNELAGGKCNTTTLKGFTFDLGPSIVILPQIYRMLFAEANRDFDSYATLVPVECQWRNFFEDRVIFDIYSDHLKTCSHIESVLPSSGVQYDRFMTYAKNQFKYANKLFLHPGFDTPFQVFLHGLFALRKLDFTRTMHQAVSHYVQEPHLRDTLDYFIKYVGSSALRAPGFMNLLSGAQSNYGLWYIKGGIYNLVHAMVDLCKELNVELHFNTEISTISTNNKRVTGVITKTGEFHPADAVISNMEVIPAYTRLLSFCNIINSKYFKRYEPACSGIVMHLGVDRIYPQLAHHNFFYAKDQIAHFRAVFDEHRLSDDPTIYVVAPTRTDQSKAPPGCDNIKILPHIPHLRNDKAYSRQDYEKWSELALDKLERMGLENLRAHIIVKDFWTPREIEQKYYSNCGSVYGVVTDLYKNFAFKAPKKSRYFRNLFFAGGSVNPGGGMPMVTLSGLYAGRMAIRYLQQN